ncbi:hypothetical protein C8Q75DRAFT_777441 [Abortiporus biennis]|nr:hypothetical protein C8Q75DRAFT_777441 [Abortiporus biennis]
MLTLEAECAGGYIGSSGRLTSRAERVASSVTRKMKDGSGDAKTQEPGSSLTKKWPTDRDGNGAYSKTWWRSRFRGASRT